MVFSGKHDKNNRKGRRTLAERLLAFLLCLSLILSGTGVSNAVVYAAEPSEGGLPTAVSELRDSGLLALEGENFTPPEEDGGDLSAILDLERGNEKGMDIELLANGKPVESGMEPIDPASTLFVRLNSIAIDNTKVKDNTKYRFQLPDTLTPVAPTGSNLSDWIQLEQLGGNTKAWGHIIGQDGHNYFEVCFQGTEGEERITAAFQYFAEIAAPYKTEDEVEAPFEEVEEFTIPLKQATTGPVITKKAEWLHNRGSSLAERNTELSIVDGNTEIYRQVLYTITIDNTGSSDSLNLTLNEKLGDGVAAFLTGDGKGWLSVSVDGVSETVTSSLASSGFAFSAASDAIQISGSTDGSLSGGGTFGTKNFEIKVSGLAGKKIEISYIADVYYDGKTSSSRTYTSDTSYTNEKGKTETKSAAAVKELTAPTVSLTHNYNSSDCVNLSSSDSYSRYTSTGMPAAKYNAGITSGGENWIEFSETGFNNSSYESYFYLLAADFTNQNGCNINAQNDFSVSCNSTKMVGAGANNCQMYNHTSLSTLLSQIKSQDLVCGLEVEALAKKENWSQSANYFTYCKKYDNPLVSYGKADQYLYMIIAPETYQMATTCVSTGQGVPQQLRLRDEDGKPCGFKVYFFNLPDKSNANDQVSVSYSRYLTRMLDSDQNSPKMPNCASYVEAKNGYRNANTRSEHNIWKETKPITKKGIVQEDGSIRWVVTVDLSEYKYWYQAQQENGNGMQPKGVLYDIIPDGYTLNGNSKRYTEEGLLVGTGPITKMPFESGRLYWRTYNSSYTSGPVTATWRQDSGVYWTQVSDFSRCNQQMLQYGNRSNLWSCNLNQGEISDIINGSNNDTLELTYITEPQGNIYISDTGFKPFDNNANLQIYEFMTFASGANIDNASVPAYDQYAGGSAIIPGVNSKTVTTKAENKAGPILIDSVLSSTLTGGPSSSGPRLNGPQYFRGVYQISDNMSTSDVTFEKEPATKLKPAQYIKLTSMKVTITPNTGSPATVEFTKEELQKADDTTGVSKQADSVGYTVRIKYSGNMEKGFTLTVYGSNDLKEIKTEYQSEFDVVQFSADSGASGMIDFDLKNQAARKYDGINNNGNALSRSAKSFRYAASPVLKKTWEGSADENHGRFRNSYEVVADVGPKGQNSVYLVDQVNQIKEYETLESMEEDKAAHTYNAEDTKTVEQLKEYLKYFKIDNLEIYVGDNRLTQEEGEEVLIYRYSTDGNGTAVDNTYKVVPMDKWTETLKNIVVPQEGEQHQQLTGNLYAFTVSRADGQPLSNETYFIIRYDLVLGENDEGESFRESDLYHGGILNLDTQAAIAYPTDQVQPAAIAKVSTRAAVYKTGTPAPIANNGWDSAGAGVSGTMFLNPATGVKEHTDALFTATVNTGSMGKDEALSKFSVADQLWVHAIINGEPVEDDERNEALTKLFFQYVTVSMQGVYLDEDGEEVQIYPKNESTKYDPKIDVKILSPYNSPTYVPKDNNKDEKGNPKEYGESQDTLFTVDGKELPRYTDVYIKYTINVDYAKLWQAALEAGLVTEEDKLTWGSTNYLQGDFPLIGDQYEFRNPSSLIGTLVKNGEANLENHTITWSTDFSVEGKINHYTLTDSLKAGNEKGEVTDNDKLALQLSEFQSFEIWDYSNEKSPRRLYKHTGEFTTETPTNIPNQTGKYSGAVLTFNDEKGFTLTFDTIEACTLRLVYTTKLDPEKFVEQEGNLSEGYKLSNGIFAEIPGAKIDSSADVEFKPDDGGYIEKTPVSGGMSHEQLWNLVAYIDSEGTTDIKISDAITPSPTSVRSYLRLSDMKVTLQTGSGEETVIYNSADGTDLLEEHTGRWEGMDLDTDGSTDFTLAFDTLPAKTKVILSYTTAVDLEALETGKLTEGTYSLKNAASLSRKGWVDETVNEDGTVTVANPLTKSGQVVTDEDGENEYDEAGQPTIDWTAEVHLLSIVSKEKLDALGAEETAKIIDELPLGLRYVDGSAKLYTVNSAGEKEEIPTASYSVTASGSTITIELKNPSAYPDLMLELQTTVYASLDSVSNSLRVEVADTQIETESENVGEVYVSRMSGRVYSVSRKTLSLTAKKYLDGALSNVPFTFQIVEVDEDGNVKEGGYTDTKQNDENGIVTFKETDKLAEGTYYYQITEVPENTLGYTHDPSVYIVKVVVTLEDTDFNFTYTVFEGDTDTEADLEEPEFHNDTLGSLSVQKKVDGDAGEKDKQFTFTVTLTDKDDQPLNQKVSYAINPENPLDSASLITAELSSSGSFDFTLKDSDTAVIYGLPYGTKYQVTEKEKDGNGYHTTVEGDTGTISNAGNAAVFTNTRNAGTLHLEKKVDGTTPGGDKKYFTFTVELKDKDGNELTGSYLYKGSASGSLESGGTIKLAAGESVDILGLPNGATYMVTEAEEKGYTPDKTEKTGTITENETEEVIFVNTYAANGSLEGAANLNVHKTIEGRLWQTDDVFTFLLEPEGAITQQAVADKKIKMPEVTSIEIGDEDNHINHFGDITFYEAGEYDFIILEQKGTKGGITYDETMQEVHVIVKDEKGDGTLTVTVDPQGADPQGTLGTPYEFTNEYSLTELRATDVSVSGTKTLEGRDFREGDSFTFTVTALDAAPLPKTTTVTIEPRIDAAGTVTGNIFTFGGEADPITYKKAGTYVYEIKESCEAPSGTDAIPGITYDAAVYRFTVVVEDNGDGTMSVASQTLERTTDGTSYTKAEKAEFKNAYNSKATSINIRGEKVLNGRGLEEDEFEFILEAPDGTPMPEGAVSADGMQSLALSHQADGSIIFDKITYTDAEAGPDPSTGMTYQYTVREKQPTVDGTFSGEALPGAEKVDDKWVYEGVTYDDSVKKISVEVWTENELQADGVTVVQVVHVEPTGNDFTFTNDYAAKVYLEGSKYLAVEKALEGRDWLEGDEYTFLLEAKDETTAKAVADGKVVLPEATELVIDDETEGHKASFGDILFLETGDYYFTVREQHGGEIIDGVSYFASAYTVHVKVSGGELGGVFDIDVDGDLSEDLKPFLFTNQYAVTELSTDVSVSGSKILNGRDFKEGDSFTFLMEAEDGAPLPRKSLAEVTPAPDGIGNTFSFGGKDDPIIYTEPGTYQYYIREMKPDTAGVKEVLGVTYADTVYRLTVTVTDNLDGTMSVTENRLEKTESRFEKTADGTSYTAAEKADFVNTYTQREAVVSINAKKELTGRTLEAQEFTFVLEAADGTPIPAIAVNMNGAWYLEAPVAADGNASFGDIIFTAEDAGETPETGVEYTYTLREKQPTADGTMSGKALSGAKLVDGKWVYKDVTYDNKEYTIRIKVWTEDVVENGTVVQVVHAERIDTEKEQPVFSNQYEEITSQTNHSPKSGDMSPIGAVALLFILSLLMGTALSVKRRKASK